MTVFSPVPNHAAADPYSQSQSDQGQAVLIAGQVAHDANGKSWWARTTSRTMLRAGLQNLDAAVRAAGGTFKYIVKINNYCVRQSTRRRSTAFRESATATLNQGTAAQHLRLREPPGAARLAVSRPTRWVIDG